MFLIQWRIDPIFHLRMLTRCVLGSWCSSYWGRKRHLYNRIVINLFQALFHSESLCIVELIWQHSCALNWLDLKYLFLQRISLLIPIRNRRWSFTLCVLSLHDNRRKAIWSNFHQVRVLSLLASWLRSVHTWPHVETCCRVWWEMLLRKIKLTAGVNPWISSTSGRHWGHTMKTSPHFFNLVRAD